MEIAPRFSPDGKRVAFALGDMEHRADRRAGRRDAHAHRARRAARRCDRPDVLPGRRAARVLPPHRQTRARSSSATSRSGAGANAGRLRRTARARASTSRRTARSIVYASLSERATPGCACSTSRAARVTRADDARASSGVDVVPALLARRHAHRVHARRLRGPRGVDRSSIGEPARCAHGRHDARPRVRRSRGWATTGRCSSRPTGSGFRALNTLDLATGPAALAGARGAQFPDVSRDGDIVYEAAAYQANLRWSTCGRAQPAQILWPSARYTNYPQFSPDGKRVRVHVEPRQHRVAVRRRVSAASARRLPLPTEFVFARAHWSHDGARCTRCAGRDTASDAAARRAHRRASGRDRACSTRLGERRQRTCATARTAARSTSRPRRAR